MAYSDYGSDVDFDGHDATNAITYTLDPSPIATANLESESLVEADNACAQCVVYVPHASQGSTGAADLVTRGRDTSQDHREALLSTGTQYSSLARRASGGAKEDDSHVTTISSVEEASGQNDTRSPLERFRTAPRKPLSVTDIVSPAWCELQYWYALTKFGKKQRTPAMRQGSAVHRALEEQVHTIVPITVQTKEDGWGLRIWNVIQGLRTLRATGLTRELEVWGVLDGQVVNGVIDEISCDCPDLDLEAKLDAQKGLQDGRATLAANQQTLEQFFRSQHGKNSVDAPPRAPVSRKRIYLTDVKTRSRPTLPNQAAMRPTVMQLMLYRTLFAALATNLVSADIIFARYDLDSSVGFTDAFLHEVGSLDLWSEESGNSGGDSRLASSSQGHAFEELQHHNNLQLLWQLMVQEYMATVTSDDMVSELLCARFVQASDGEVIGSKCFSFDQEALARYVRREMQWWKGERPAEGVDVEEAYKCRICEFAEECTWRKDKIEEAVGRHRERRRTIPNLDADLSKVGSEER